MRLTTIGWGWVLATLFPIVALAADVTVPTDYASIQEALDATEFGDTIFVEAGTYTGTIIVNADDSGKTLRSVAGAETTTLDGAGDGPVVTLDSVSGGFFMDGFTITGGDAPQAGGGILAMGTASGTVRNCRIQGNRAPVGGGVANHDSSSVAFETCVIDGNGKDDDGEPITDFGGGVEIFGLGADPAPNPTFFNCTISNNAAFLAGGGVVIEEAGGTFDRCVILSNRSDYSGGGVDILRDQGASFINTTITGNVSQLGGGISGSEATTAFTRCLVSNNTADYGGGFGASERAHLEFAECTFSANQATQDGGGVYIQRASTTSFERCSFVDNQAAGNGGGIAVVANFIGTELGSFDISNANIRGNEAGGFGGGAAVIVGKGSIASSIIESNRAPDGAGVAIRRLQGSPRSIVAPFSIFLCAIRSNVASGAGGGVLFDDHSGMTLSLCTLRDNVAATGAGVALQQTGALVQNCLFFANRGDYGAAIAGVSGGPHPIVSCTITENEASQGGAIALLGDTDGSLSNSLVVGNVGPYAVYAETDDADLTIHHSNLFGHTPAEVTPDGGTTGVNASAASLAGIGWDGTGVLSLDPRFAEPIARNYRLQPDSPCIDMGDRDDPDLASADLDRNRRMIGSSVDMGCYEDVPPVPVPALSEWGLMILAALMAGLVLHRIAGRNEAPAAAA